MLHFTHFLRKIGRVKTLGNEITIKLKYAINENKHINQTNNQTKNKNKNKQKKMMITALLYFIQRLNAANADLLSKHERNVYFLFIHFFFISVFTFIDDLP